MPQARAGEACMGIKNRVCKASGARCYLATGRLSSLALGHSAAQPGAGLIDRDGEQQHGDDHGRRLGVVKKRELEIEQLAEPAGTDKTQDGRHPDIHFPTVERVGD